MLINKGMSIPLEKQRLFQDIMQGSDQTCTRDDDDQEQQANVQDNGQSSSANPAEDWVKAAPKHRCPLGQVYTNHCTKYCSRVRTPMSHLCSLLILKTDGQIMQRIGTRRDVPSLGAQRGQKALPSWLSSSPVYEDKVKAWADLVKPHIKKASECLVNYHRQRPRMAGQEWTAVAALSELVSDDMLVRLTDHEIHDRWRDIFNTPGLNSIMVTGDSPLPPPVSHHSNLTPADWTTSERPFLHAQEAELGAFNDDGILMSVTNSAPWMYGSAPVADPTWGVIDQNSYHVNPEYAANNVGPVLTGNTGGAGMTSEMPVRANVVPWGGSNTAFDAAESYGPRTSHIHPSLANVPPMPSDHAGDLRHSQQSPTGQIWTHPGAGMPFMTPSFDHPSEAWYASVPVDESALEYLAAARRGKAVDALHAQQPMNALASVFFYAGSSSLAPETGVPFIGIDHFGQEPLIDSPSRWYGQPGSTPYQAPLGQAPGYLEDRNYTVHSDDNMQAYGTTAPGHASHPQGMPHDSGDGSQASEYGHYYQPPDGPGSSQQ